jgi:exodeoxyribonuclease V alpha subunit
VDENRQTTTLSGVLDRIVYQNQTTQWTVARLLPAEGEAVTVVGALLGVSPGTALMLHGAWTRDPRYGLQFRFDSYSTQAPETLLGLERYLGSGLIPGIGPELAKRIVAAFGMQTLEVINQTPPRLVEVDGIGETRARRIAEAWNQQREVQDVMVFLRGHGVSSAYAARIYKQYGAQAVGIIRQNPYRLSADIWGIGFRTADRIAHSLGIAPTASERLESGLVHVLGELTGEGHVHTPDHHLIEAAAAILEVDPALLSEPLDRLVAARALIREELPGRGRCSSLASLWENEREAALAFAAVATTPSRTLEIDLPRVIGEFEKLSGIALAPQQRRAVEAATRQKCVVITGGPGVGKTTIVRAVLAALTLENRQVALAAPTGRAAKRLAETTGAHAQTLHRLLGFQPRTGSFEHNADHRLDADVVIVDEASMIDIAMLRSLLIALRPAAQLVLVGDIDQLPSVGPGAVLADIIASGAATVVELTEIFRQAQASQIVVNAHRVNRGQRPNLARPAAGAESDFFFIERSSPPECLDTVLELVAERIPRRFGFDPLTEIQVLTPMHRGELGTIALNNALQTRLNPERPGEVSISRGQRTYRIGDKVMQVRNDYDKEIFNGDLAVIGDIGDQGRALTLTCADGRHIEYTSDEVDQLVHAYAVSIHKSQGSEYPAVVIPLLTQHYMMLQRNLLYTAITRGKQLVVLVGAVQAVSMAVRNDSVNARWTWLAQRIRDACAALGAAG